MRARDLSICALVAVLAAGCHPGNVEHLANASPATLPTGWTTFEDPESGASIGIPPGWSEGTGLAADSPMANSPLAGDAGGGDPSAAANQSSDAGQAAAALGRMSQAMDEQNEKKARDLLRSKGVVINVTDGSKSTIGEQRTRFYVKQTKHDSDYTFEMATLDEKSHLLNAGAGTDVVLPVGKAHRYRADNTMVTGDKETQISYILDDGPNTYVIRFISTNQPTVFDNFEKQVAESFRVKHKSP